MISNESDQRVESHELDMEYIARQLTQLCGEYVEITNTLNELNSQKKELNQRSKELATRITSLMQMSELDEVNCGTKHKILLQEKKTTSGMKINDISTIINSYTDVSNEIKQMMLNQIKDTRVTTFKSTIKLKNI
tara:strand:- start:54 stop:458 length:405 start_codon:yes stop_codon:yes gene_type:complete